MGSECSTTQGEEIIFVQYTGSGHCYEVPVRDLTSLCEVYKIPLYHATGYRISDSCIKVLSVHHF